MLGNSVKIGTIIKCSSIFPVILAVVLVRVVEEQIANTVKIILRKRFGNLGLGNIHDLVRGLLLPGQDGEPFVFHRTTHHVAAEVIDVVVIVVRIKDLEALKPFAIAIEVAHRTPACPL